MNCEALSCSGVAKCILYVVLDCKNGAVKFNYAACARNRKIVPITYAGIMFDAFAYIPIAMLKQGATTP